MSSHGFNLRGLTRVACASSCLALATMGLAMIGTPAYSATQPIPVQLKYSGTITYVSEQLAAAGIVAPRVGDTLTGSVVYDTIAYLQNGSFIPNQGPGRTYRMTYPPSFMKFAASGFSFSSVSVPGSMTSSLGYDVPSDIDGALVDTFVLQSASTGPIPLKAVLRLEDTTRTRPGFESIPPNVKLEEYDRESLDFYTRDAVPTLILSATVDSVTGGDPPPGRVNVAGYGVDSPTCGAIKTPCRSIGQGLANAGEGFFVLVYPGLYGDLNGDGDFADAGEEHADPVRHCLVCITKGVRLFAFAGAEATIIDGRGTTDDFDLVLIDANHVTFAGFMVRAGLASGVRVSSNANNVQIERVKSLDHQPDDADAGNAAFEILSARGTVDVTDCEARSSNIGFLAETSGAGRIVVKNAVTKSNRRAGFKLAGSSTASGNAILLDHGKSFGDNPGFDISGAKHQIRFSTAVGERDDGFIIAGSRHVLDHASAMGNPGAGFNVHPGATDIRISAANVYQNALIDNSGKRNCGILNSSGHLVDASGSFFGATTGPGPELPANAAGAPCNSGAGSSTKVVPFAKTSFVIE